MATAPFEYASFAEMLDIRLGGVAIYGAVIAAFLSGYFACRWRKVPILPMFDLAGMGFLLGQGIGRWGNFVNQEAFGTNTTLPGACTAKAPAITSQACRKRWPRRALRWTRPCRCTLRFCMNPSGACWAFPAVGIYEAPQIPRRADLDVCDVVRRGALLCGGPAHRQPDGRQLRISQVIAAVSVIAALCIWLALRKSTKTNRSPSLIRRL